MAIDASGNITVNRTGTTSLRFDTSGLVNPTTYVAVSDLGSILWTLKVDKGFTLPLDLDSTNPAIRWFRFTAAHAAQLGNDVRAFEIRADFGTGPQPMASGEISAVGLSE
ncbi:hypothetical protein MOP88_14345 [Sphingomonas sp. WKB10]|nr:hypothetical protein [Sphingomonas sp. WKB10]